jgi:hypothetical protein
MSQSMLESLEDVRVTVRRIDAPHTVGAPAAEHVPVLETVGAGNCGGASLLEGWLQSDGLDLEPVSYSEDSAAHSDPPELALAESAEDLSRVAEALSAREEQLDHQTGQLADQLQQQLREIEHREAQLNARAAELDNEFRLARLWTQEKLAEVREREEQVAAAETALLGRQSESASVAGDDAAAQLEAPDGQLSHRLESLARRDRELQDREAALAPREAQLVSKEAQLRERRQTIEREATALHHARQDWERIQDQERAEIADERKAIRRELVAALDDREQEVATGENALAESTKQLEQDRAALSRERADWQRQKASEQEAIARLRTKAEAEISQRSTRINSREAALDQQQSALDQLRGEITAAHRQSIEMRLMAEQLWSQVQGRMPPVEITQSIAQLRLKLAEQYKLEQQTLDEQKRELLELAEKVTDQSAALRQHRQELQNWFTARDEEIERHAKSLVVREQELLEQAEQLQEAELTAGGRT